MAINRGNFGKALFPGVNKWYGDAYAKHATEWTALYEQDSSRKAFEEEVGVTGFGMAGVIGEGENVSFDTMRQGFITRYTMVKYGLGFIITSEMIADNQYAEVAKNRAQALAFSMQQTKETVGANVFNRAFNSSYTGGDGKELLATDHPNITGGTWSNELTTAADLSQAALEQALIDISKFTNDRGMKIAVMATKLIIPFDLQFEAERILQSPLESGNSNNDINTLRGKLTFTANHYLTDTDAWFLRTNVPMGMKHFIRQAQALTEDNDFDSDNLKYKAVERYAFGWTDPRGLFGSPGA